MAKNQNKLFSKYYTLPKVNHCLITAELGINLFKPAHLQTNCQSKSKLQLHLSRISLNLI